MSRMIIAFCSLAILSGCCSFNPCNQASRAKARVATLGKNPICDSRRCDNCIPSRPFTFGYEPWWDDHITRYSAQCSAYRALGGYRAQCGSRVSHHFKMGFISAYEDLALNRRPSPPIIPPAKYWNAYYRSCAGRPCVDDWYAGYDAGLSLGSNNGVSRFHELYLRRNSSGVNTANRYDVGPNPQINAVQQPVPIPLQATPVPMTNTPDGQGRYQQVGYQY